jgi:hypothetical protein
MTPCRSGFNPDQIQCVYRLMVASFTRFGLPLQPAQQNPAPMRIRDYCGIFSGIPRSRDRKARSDSNGLPPMVVTLRLVALSTMLAVDRIIAV